MEPNLVVAAWDKLINAYHMALAQPGNSTALERMQETLDPNFGRIQSSFDLQARENLKHLRGGILEKCPDSSAKHSVLYRIDSLCRTRLGQEVINPFEKKIDEIEANLPEDCFPSFKRDADGRVIEPEKQLEQFSERLKVMAQALDEMPLLGHHALPLHSYNLLNANLSFLDFIRAAQLVVDYNFLRAFDRDLHSFNLGIGRTISLPYELTMQRHQPL